MEAPMTLLGLCGSLRAGSTNRKLMQEAARAWGGAFVEGGLRFPLYDGDLEVAEGIPDAVAKLAGQIAAAEAVIVVSPEYNKSISGVLKNALDWVSRVKGNPWKGKPVALLSANDGREGGARGQFATRLALNYARPRLLTGPEVMVAAASEAFDADGRLVSERYAKQVVALMDALKDEVARG
jgi:chromate reductase